jgi:hypothetical protein
MPSRLCLLFAAVVSAAPSGAAAQNPVTDFLKKVDRLAKKVACPAGDAACNEKNKPPAPEPGQSGAGALPALGATFEVTPLAPASTLQNVVAVSDDGTRAAGVVAKGSRFAVMVDGQVGPVFDGIQAGVGSTGYQPPVAFGPAGRSVAYVAKRDGKAIAVVNGKEGPPFDRIDAERAQGPAQGRVFHFSGDGDRVAYVGVTQPPQGLGTSQVVVDGVAGPVYQRVSGVMFAGARLAYLAQKGRNAVVVIDGKEGPEFDGVASLQGNGDGHVAYVGTRGMAWSVVVDGVEVRTHQRPAEEFYPLAFVLAPSGPRVAYAAVVRTQGNPSDQQTLYVDGKPLRTAVGFRDIVFSPDGARLAVAFMETLSGGMKVMCDDWTSLSYQGVSETSATSPEYRNLQFSPDGKRFAFIASNGQKSFAVVDREESDGYAVIRNFRFSADSRRYAFEAFTGNVGPVVGWYVVVDGKPGPKLYQLTDGSLTFSPDGSRVAYAGQFTVMESVAVIDGATQKAAVTPFQPRAAKAPELWGRRLRTFFAFSPDGKRLAYAGQLMNATGQTVAIVDGQAQGTAHLFANPTFSPDGRRFAHAAWFNQKWHLRVDGRSVEMDGELFEIPRALAFEPDGRLRMLVVKDGMLNKVVATLK